MKDQGITPVMPPPKHAVVHEQNATAWHDKIVQYIKDKGSVYAFHKKYGYGKRSLVESQISRITRCIGASLFTQTTDSQQLEGITIANISISITYRTLLPLLYIIVRYKIVIQSIKVVLLQYNRMIVKNELIK